MTNDLHDDDQLPQWRDRGLTERMRMHSQPPDPERRQYITAALILVAMFCMTLVALCGIAVWALK